MRKFLRNLLLALIPVAVINAFVLGNVGLFSMAR